MQLFKSIIFFALAGLVIIFAFQNFESVQISFLTWNVEVPLAFAVLIIYVLGAISGGLMMKTIKKLTAKEKSDSK